VPCIAGLHCHHRALGHLAITLHSLETIKLLDVFEVDLEAMSFPEVIVIEIQLLVAVDLFEHIGSIRTSTCASHAVVRIVSHFW